MSILNVNTIQPVGSGQTITVSAANISAPSTVVTASSFVGPLTGNVTGNVTGGSLSGISTLGVTTAYVGAINDGPISGARNRIINGDMRIDQRNTGSSVTPTADSGYTLDRWQVRISASSKFSIQQSSTAPAGFTNSILVTSLAATTPTGSDYYFITQKVEGFNTGDLAWGSSDAKAVTLSFWVRSSLTGTFGGVLQNSASNRSYPFSYAISSADTWEQKTITIAGDTSGTWLTTNGIGIGLRIDLGSGSSLRGTAGSWADSDLVAPTGATSVVATNGATFYITGVQLEAGTVATPFERRSYGQELALCQRYCQVITPSDIQGANYYHAWTALTSGGQMGCYTYVVPMRATPTGPSTASVFYIANNTGGSITRNITLNYTVNAVTYTYLSANNGATLATTYEFFSGAGTTNTIIAAEL